MLSIAPSRPWILCMFGRRRRSRTLSCTWWRRRGWRSRCSWRWSRGVLRRGTGRWRRSRGFRLKVIIVKKTWIFKTNLVSFGVGLVVVEVGTWWHHLISSLQLYGRPSSRSRPWGDRRCPDCNRRRRGCPWSHIGMCPRMSGNLWIFDILN